MIRVTHLSLLILLVVGVVPYFQTVQAGEILLVNGRMMRGRILEVDKNILVFRPEQAPMDKVTLKRKEIESYTFSEDDPYLLKDTMKQRDKAQLEQDLAIKAHAMTLSPLWYEFAKSLRHSGNDALSSRQYQTALSLYANSIKNFKKAINLANEVARKLKTPILEPKAPEKKFLLSKEPHFQENLKFSIHFPIDWTITPNLQNKSVTFLPDEDDLDNEGASLTIFSGLTDQVTFEKLQEFTYERVAKIPTLLMDFSGETRLGGSKGFQMAVHKEGNPTVECTIVVSKGPEGRYYCIMATQPLGQYGPLRRRMLYQAIRTFKFTD